MNPFKNKTEPGPGLYSPKRFNHTISYSISKRNDGELTDDKITPGPGNYGDIRKSYYSNIPGSKIGKDYRKAEFLRTSSHSKPGPGVYKTLCFTDANHAPKFGFGTSYREKNYSETALIPPGPSNYNIGGTLGNGTPIATMPGRRADLRPKTGKDAPGAGAYDPEYKALR